MVIILSILAEHKYKFHTNIIGVTCNPRTKELYVGLNNLRFLQRSDSEIWSLNVDLSPNELLFSDSVTLIAMKGCISNKDWTTLATMFTQKGHLSKAITVDSKTGPKVLLKPAKTHLGRITQMSFTKEHDSCVVLDGPKPKVLCNDTIADLSEYIDIPDRKRACVYASLQEFLDKNPELPEILIGEGCYQLKAFKNRKMIFSHDYRNRFERLAPHAMTMGLICKYHENALYTLFVNWGKGLHDLKMLKDFKDYWALDHTSGPALVMDLDGDGTEELICGGGDNREWGSFIKIFKNIYDEKPLLLEKVKAPFLTGLLAEDINNDGKIELIAYSDRKIIVYQISEQ